MRICSFNINGLRAVLKRRFGDIATLLNFLQADIICFQETKLTKAELDRDLALVEGWDSFFSHCKDRSYSGVATYCRKAVTVPVAAEQGITGLLHCKTASANEVEIPNCYEELCNRFTQDELLAIDLEGRCVITDHGHFILFNLYGPAITNEESAEERFAYKLRLYKALQLRMEACLAAGRAVVLLGDLNICPNPIDSCEPGDVEVFRSRADKKWLQSVMLGSGGYFVDLFRHFHPERKEVYSCWSTASGARVNNYGARIDLILLAEPQNLNMPQASARSVDDEAGSQPRQASSLLQQCTASDVWMDAQGSDHAPAWAEFDFLEPLLIADAAPALSTRYMFTGIQRKLTSWFGSNSAQELASQPTTCNAVPASTDTDIVASSSAATQLNVVSDVQTATEMLASSTQGSQDFNLYEAVGQGLAGASGQAPKQASAAALSGRLGSSSKTGSKPVKAGQKSLKCFFQPPAPKATATTSAATHPVHVGRDAETRTQRDQSQSASSAAFAAGSSSSAPTDKARQAAASRLNMPDASLAGPYQGSTSAPSHSLIAHDASAQGSRQSSPLASDQAAAAPIRPEMGHTGQRGSDQAIATSLSQGPDAAEKAAATEAWSRIHSKMKAPKCKGHSEDCVIREVKKNGPNKGRLFYVCRRPDGKPPQGRCDHFEWVGNRTSRGPTSHAQPSALKRLRKA